MKRLPCCAAGLAALALQAGHTHAAERIESHYTKRDFARCPVVAEHETGRTHRCSGYAGVPVTYISDEHSALVGFDGTGRAASTSFLDKHYGEVGETIEWRSVDKERRPFAAIVRVRVSTNASISGPRRPVLVVYKLGPSASCVAAVVSATRVNANAKAREVADTVARRFRCGQDVAIEDGT